MSRISSEENVSRCHEMVILTLLASFWIAFNSLTSVNASNRRLRDQFPVIRTSNGYVRGKTLLLPGGKSVSSFLGIPYAKAPVGHLRFKHPVAADPWFGTLDATRFGKSCYQKNFYYFRDFPGFERLNPRTRFSEDCLSINVFVPSSVPVKYGTSAVMVFIHGGGFSIGGTSSPLYDGNFLAAQENIIVVSMNYRLASFGFLYLNHPDFEPNCGLMDQLLALKWIRRNIGFFGGNPDDVTLFGQSAGAISIGYHMMSPLSKGLFKRAILQSGTPFLDWILQRKSESEELAVETGRNLGCFKYRNETSLGECLKSVHPKSLVDKEPRRRLLPFIFKPVIDGNFIMQDPVTSAAERKHFRDMDVMLGVVRDEGTLFLTLFLPQVFLPLVDRVGPYHEEFMECVRFFVPNECRVFYESVELLYTDWDNFNNTQSTLKSMITTINDYQFNCPREEFARLYSSMGNDVYSYNFPYRSPRIDFVKWLGVPHTEELRYLMGEVANSQIYSDDEKRFASRLARYWANFARTGNPNTSPPNTNGTSRLIRWPKYNEEGEVLLLQPRSAETFIPTDSYKCAFWKMFRRLKELKRKNKCPSQLKL